MNAPVVIFGANGFIGRYLTRHFSSLGREVVAVGRCRKGWSGDGMFLEWDGRTQGPWVLALEGAGLVINLAGRSVNCRYTPANRHEIKRSRVETTKLIGEAIAGCRLPPAVWMNAGTATWYRDARDRPQNEWSGEPGEGFSVEVAQAWEEAFFGARVAGETRKVGLRIGMVLANEPATVFDVVGDLVRKGLGGPMDGGGQRVSWIHMEDLIAAITRLEADPLADGIFNLTAPEAPTNREWMRAFRELHGSPVGLPMPGPVLEMGACLKGTETELVTKSRWVEPARLTADGFRWRWPELAMALQDLARRPGLEGFFHVPERRALGVRGWTVRRSLRPA